ncbi:MAG: argininosuccinate synthase [Kiritimatiellaeota bacterium]|nr:argininosuccinate synthase [Kiritimatiellota bacterium]
MTLKDLKNETVGACVSGGLDSRTIAKAMTDLGVKVIGFTADLGQPDEVDIEDIRKRMAPCGVDTHLVDLKKEMAEACFEALQAQAMYDGGYWNSTGIGRAVTVRGLLGAMEAAGCTVLAHGATGRGNDQMRFERYTNVLRPDMRVYAPWRDPAMLARFPGRTQMAAFLAKAGLPAPTGGKKKYSTDSNLAGLSHEAEDLESLETSMLIVEPTMGVWPMRAPDAPGRVVVRVEKGRCVALNGKKLSPVKMMQAANKIAGTHGVGMKHALENRIIGTKSRGVYEAPGMELLGAAIRYVYQATMDRRATLLFQQLSKLVADHIYDGRWFDPAAQAAAAAIAVLARHATATVTLSLYKGNIFFDALADCPASLYREADASMEASDGLNPVSSQGFAEIQSVEARSLAWAKQTR